MNGPSEPELKIGFDSIYEPTLGNEITMDVEEIHKKVIEYACLQAGICAVHPETDPTKWPPPLGKHHQFK